MMKIFQDKIQAAVILILVLFLSACSIAPQRSIEPTETVAAYLPPTLVPTQTPTPKPTQTPLPSEEDCSNVLLFIDDLSYPDGTEVQPGQLIDKMWLVQNAGTCNWDRGYVLKQSTDSDMDAVALFDLYPARAKSEATIRVQFFAPETPGTYKVTWQPFDADGTLFYDPIFIIFTIPEETE
ncbi:MAG: hypothetical protein JW750_03070 [Anaerolineaceae bacterium]|nr:hypothetical protein [Anaerolineaceae bacterium]